MFGSKSCHIRVAIDTAAEITLFRSTFSSARRADTTFDEWTYARVFIHIHFLVRSLIHAFRLNTLSLSRVDIVISRSGSLHDASHLPSSSLKRWFASFWLPNGTTVWMFVLPIIDCKCLYSLYTTNSKKVVSEAQNFYSRKPWISKLQRHVGLDRYSIIMYICYHSCFVFLI